MPVEPQESITDPAVSFDAQWVYFAKFHHMTTGPSASMTNLQSRNGVLVNGKRIGGRVSLQVGDRILIGAQELTLLQGRAVTSRATSRSWPTAK